MRIVREGTAFCAVPDVPGERLRIALLRSDDWHHRYLESELARHLELLEVVVEPGRLQQRRLWRDGRRSAWAWRGYQGVRQRLTGRASYRGRYFAPLLSDPVRPVPTVEVDWVCSDATRSELVRLDPDVTVVCGTSYLRPAVLECVNSLFLNLHGGCLPDYRGNHGIFFAFERGDYGSIGATVHFVAQELDAGHVVGVFHPPILPHDHDEHLYCKSAHGGAVMLRMLLQRLEAGETLTCTPQPEAGETFRHRDRTPALEARLWLRRHVGLHHVPHIQRSEPSQPDWQGSGPSSRQEAR